jgi:hypothetical protein
MRRATLAGLGALLAASVAREAAAHPAGTTSVNRYVGVSLVGAPPDASAPGIRVHLAYLLDFAELPAYGEIESLDADHDGSVTPAEQEAYLARRLGPIVDRWTVEVDGVKIAPRVTGSNLEVLAGEQGLSTLRIAADVEAEAPGSRAPGADVRVHVVDPAFADRSGWRQMAAEASPEATLANGPATATPVLAYGDAPNDTPPRVDDRVFLFRLQSPAPGAARSTKRGIGGLLALFAVAILLGGCGWVSRRRRRRPGI